MRRDGSARAGWRVRRMRDDPVWGGMGDVSDSRRMVWCGVMCLGLGGVFRRWMDVCPVDTADCIPSILGNGPTAG